MATCAELLRKGTKILREREITVPRLEAEVLLAFAWGRSRTDLLIFSEEEVPDQVSKMFYDLLERRCQGIPIAYLTGEKEFMSLPFAVSPAVLIPRPETELLVEEVLAFLSQREQEPYHLIADVGTGSGAVAVSLAFYDQRARLVATDISESALEIAAANARQNGVLERVEFLQGELLSPLLDRGERGTGTAVAANLPYIPTAEIAGLPLDVRCEPLLALDGGDDGLELYRRLIPQAQMFLQPGGLLACEVGPGQGRCLAELLAAQGWDDIRISRDYAGQERLVLAENADCWQESSCQQSG
jgi:release factor glutamine methyltransferase